MTNFKKNSVPQKLYTYMNIERVEWFIVVLTIHAHQDNSELRKERERLKRGELQSKSFLRNDQHAGKITGSI